MPGGHRLEGSKARGESAPGPGPEAEKSGIRIPMSLAIRHPTRTFRVTEVQPPPLPRIASATPPAAARRRPRLGGNPGNIIPTKIVTQSLPVL